MTIHHATDETLMRYAAGTLTTGPRIVVEAHLADCAACRARVGTYEAVGGALLEQAEPTALSPSALADVLSLQSQVFIVVETDAHGRNPFP